MGEVFAVRSFSVPCWPVCQGIDVRSAGQLMLQLAYTAFQLSLLQKEQKLHLAGGGATLDANNLTAHLFALETTDFYISKNFWLTIYLRYVMDHFFCSSIFYPYSFTFHLFQTDLLHKKITSFQSFTILSIYFASSVI
jgi:outer membrane translocation and assembly module TamA